MARSRSKPAADQPRPLPAPRDDVSAECARMLEALRARCPGLLPSAPLKTGEVAAAIPVATQAVTQLAQTAARPAGVDTLLWSDGDSELLVDAAAVRVELAEGLVRVLVPVRCDQIRQAVVQVTFVVGDEKRPAGLFAATETRPRGPAAVVDVWGEALTAFAWQVVLRVVAAVAGESGADVDGARLIPAAISASEQGLRILPMARHAFDRVIR